MAIALFLFFFYEITSNIKNEESVHGLRRNVIFCGISQTNNKGSRGNVKVKKNCRHPKARTLTEKENYAKSSEVRKKRTEM